jgi:prevent-host-death family protein
MKTASIAEVKTHLSAYLAQCENEGPVVITRKGKAVAVLLSPHDEDDLERLLLSRSPRFKALLNKSRRSIEAGKGLPRADFWKTVEKRSLLKRREKRESTE